MKILVTGGTGFLGRPLIRRLLETGDTINVLTRDPEFAEKVLPPRVKIFAWNASGPVPQPALDGIEAIAHLAGENIGGGRWTMARKRRIRESRTRGTRSLVESLANVRPRPRVLVSASGVGYYGDGGDRILDEDAPRGTGFLAEVAEDWESEVFRAETCGLRVAAIRNGLILGRGGALGKLLPLYKLGLGVVFGSGLQYWSWIHLNDAVDLFAWALHTEGARGPINGCAPHPITQRQFSRVFADTLHRPLMFRVPSPALRFILGEAASSLTEGQNASAKKIVSLGFNFRFPRLEMALRDILS